MALTVWENVTVTGQYAGLVAASWKGQTYLRSAPAKVNNNSPKQKLHKLHYKQLYQVINVIREKWANKYFKSNKMTPSNMIVKAQPLSFWHYGRIYGNNNDNFNSPKFNLPTGTLQATISATVIYNRTTNKITIKNFTGTNINLITELLFIWHNQTESIFQAEIITNFTQEYTFPVVKPLDIYSQRYWLQAGNGTITNALSTALMTIQ